jgi:hypothetical protein
MLIGVIVADGFRNDSVVKLLTCLIHHPFMVSFIEEFHADELIERGFFDMNLFEVTPLGRDYLQSHFLRVGAPEWFRPDTMQLTK